MTDTPERIMEIRKVTYPSGIGNIQDAMMRLSIEEQALVLIARMEEEIVRIGKRGLTLVDIPAKDIMTCYCLEWGDNGIEDESRLEATFTVWQAVQEQQQQ